MQIERLTWLRAGSASCPSGTLGANLEVLISPSPLDEDSWSFCEHPSGTFARKISPESRSPIFSPSEPTGQAMVFIASSYRRRDPWRLHMLHRVLPCHLMLPHTHVGLPASIATLPAPITASNLVRCARPFGPPEQD